MAHLVSALYHDRQKARLAAGDLISAGVLPESIVVADGLQLGSGRLEVYARDMDHAIDVRSYLEQDGAHSVEIRHGTSEVPAVETIPQVPAPGV